VFLTPLMLEFRKEAVVFFLCLLKVKARYYALLVLQEACTHTGSTVFHNPLLAFFNKKVFFCWYSFVTTLICNKLLEDTFHCHGMTYFLHNNK
jgi:hypothetical protein